MVQIHVKKGEESQFLLDCTASVPMNELTVQVATLYNDCLRIGRLCDGMRKGHIADGSLMCP